MTEALEKLSLLNNEEKNFYNSRFLLETKVTLMLLDRQLLIPHFRMISCYICDCTQRKTTNGRRISWEITVLAWKAKCILFKQSFTVLYSHKSCFIILMRLRNFSNHLIIIICWLFKCFSIYYLFIVILYGYMVWCATGFYIGPSLLQIVLSVSYIIN